MSLVSGNLDPNKGNKLFYFSLVAILLVGLFWKKDGGKKKQHPVSRQILIHDVYVEGHPLDKAEKSLPSGLEIKPSTIAGAGMGVFATRGIPSHVRFDAYGGTVVFNEDDLALNGTYAWSILRSGKIHHYMDGFDKRYSNWLRYINCARKEKEQNLFAYQKDEEIFYRSYKDITIGQELLVYYGDEYAHDLNITNYYDDT